MTYQTPELFLVGAAQGLVLGANGNGDFSDKLATCITNDSSRGNPWC